MSGEVNTTYRSPSLSEEDWDTIVVGRVVMYWVSGLTGCGTDKALGVRQRGEIFSTGCV